MLAFHESANMFQEYAKACCKNHTKSGVFIFHLRILEVRLVALAVEVARAEFSISTAIVFSFPALHFSCLLPYKL